MYEVNALRCQTGLLTDPIIKTAKVIQLATWKFYTFRGHKNLHHTRLRYKIITNNEHIFSQPHTYYTYATSSPLLLTAYCFLWFNHIGLAHATCGMYTLNGCYILKDFTLHVGLNYRHNVF